MRAFETTLEFEPKTYDIDYAGIVSNQVYIRWLEDLRFEMIKKHYGWDNFPEAVAPVLLRTEIDYRKAVRLFERVKGVMWIEALKGSRWFLRAEFLNSQGEVVAEAKQIGAFFNMKTGRPVRPPEQLRRALSES